MLRKNGFSIEQLRSLATDYRRADLEPAEVAMMAYAETIARQANDVTDADVAALKAFGFTDAEILDIALAAAARCFFSKALCALGAAPDEAYNELAAAMKDVLPD